MPSQPGNVVERIWRLTDRSGPCWLWLGQKDRLGYARIQMPTGKRGGKSCLAHCVSYELFVGPIPEGLELDHVKDRGCTSRACVNPAHLEPVMHRENSLRGESFSALNARKTRCPQGHPYDDRNTVVINGARRCRICRRAQGRDYWNRKKASA